MMTAQPVFLFKPELLFYFSKGMSKSRGDVFSPRRTVQSHLANQVCLFRQGHTVVAEDTQTCPWQQMDGKEESGKMAGTCLRLQKEQDSPIHFSFAGPKPSLLITSPLATVMQVHSLASSSSDSDQITFLPFPITRGGSQGPVSPQCAEEWDEAGGDTSFRDLAMRNDSPQVQEKTQAQEENY